jgi:hypothetical protein
MTVRILLSGYCIMVTTPNAVQPCFGKQKTGEKHTVDYHACPNLNTI